MPYNDADTRAKLIDPVIHRCGWTEDLIRRDETAGTVEIINRKGRRHSRGRIDHRGSTPAQGAVHQQGATGCVVERTTEGVEEGETFDDIAFEKAEAKVKEIEDAVYDLKAVNPNKKPVVDTRTPEELMDIIEETGREVADVLATLREGMKV